MVTVGEKGTIAHVGTFVIEVIGPGTYSIVAEGDGFGEQTINTEVKDGETTHVEIPLRSILLQEPNLAIGLISQALYAKVATGLMTMHTDSATYTVYRMHPRDVVTMDDNARARLRGTRVHRGYCFYFP